LAFRKAVNVGSVIITKLDGHAKGGGALSAVAATESPITFIGLGEHFDDFESFDASSFIRRILGMGDISKLFESVKSVVNIEDQRGMIEKLKEGKFTIRDLQSQFKSILNLGSLNQFMSMIPGMGTSILNKGNEKESINRIKRFLNIMNSMTGKELDGEGHLDHSRVVRIARGSGTSVEEVHLLLEEYKKLSKVVGKLGKTNLGKGRTHPICTFFKGNEITNLQRNPNQVMSKMKGALD
jgi:signal recognition particle subunit SRP54